jgi:hypothetical protein
MFGGLFVLNPWPLYFRGAVTFSFLIHFRWLLVCQMCQEERFKFLFRHQKQWSPPLGSNLPWALKVFGHRPVYPTVIYCFAENLSKGDTVFWNQNNLSKGDTVFWNQNNLSQILVFEKKNKLPKNDRIIIIIIIIWGGVLPHLWLLATVLNIAWNNGKIVLPVKLKSP